jgi:hypothetical protein
MALRTPPSWLQQGSHTAENDRLTAQAAYATTGIIGSSSLAVTANATPAMNVNIASGWAAIVGTTQTNMGVYVGYNDATTNIAVSTADATNPRIDRVVMTVNDAYYSGLTNNVTFTVVAGTPAASPTAPNTPANSISLATIAVAAAATTIVSGNITDTRVVATSNAFMTPAGGTFSGSITTPNLTTTAGTSSVAPVNLTAGTNLGTSVGGAIEYNGSTAFFTPASTATNTTNGGRALLPATHFYVLNADRASTITTPGEAAFGVRLTVQANTNYEFDAHMLYQVVNSAGSGTLNIGHNGTATITSISYQVDYASASNALNTTATMNSFAINTTAATTLATVSSASPGVSVFTKIIVKGFVRFSTAGTFNIQSQVSSNTTATLLANSFVKMTPINQTTAQVIGAWA